MSFDNEQQDKLTHSDIQKLIGKDFGLTIVKNFLMKLKRGWAGIFRFLFITSIGVIGYFWLDPQNLGDIPFSQLTPNLIFNNLLAIGIILGCFRWFFSFPDKYDEDEYYNMWANFSGLLGGLVIVIGIIWGGWLK